MKHKSNMSQSQSRKAFESMVSAIPNGLIDKKELVEKTGVFWDFQDYVVEKFGISEKESEDRFKTYIMGKLASTPEKLSDPAAYIEHLREYAIECEFNEPDKLVEGFRYMSYLNATIKVD